VSTPTQPTITGVIIAPHQIVLDPGQVVVIGEAIQPETPMYNANVAITEISITEGGTTITTNRTFLPLNRMGISTTFKVISTP
jgi:hypothetical protein